MFKDPETGKRVSRPNPPEKWQVVEVPHLRIVSDDLWDAAQARKKLYGGKRTHERRRPKHMFSSAAPSAGVHTPSRTTISFACSAHREKGTCNNNRTIRVEELERRVLQGIERRPLAPDAIADFLLEYHAEQKRLRAATTKKRREAEKRLGVIMRQIKSIISAIADGIATREMKTTLLEIDREKEALENELLSFEQLDTVVELHPAAVDAYRRAVANLQSALTSDDKERREAMDIIRSLVTSIDVIPQEGRGQVELHVCGALAELLNLPNRRPGEPPDAVMMVAEGALPSISRYDRLRVLTSQQTERFRRALPSHGRGHRFNPCRAHHKTPAKSALCR